MNEEQVKELCRIRDEWHQYAAPMEFMLDIVTVARNAALEEAAKVADSVGDDVMASWAENSCRHIASDIRALKEKP